MLQARDWEEIDTTRHLSDGHGHGRSQGHGHACGCARVRACVSCSWPANEP